MEIKKYNSIIGLALTTLFLSACSSLPTSGPSHSAILEANSQSSDKPLPEVNVVELDNGLVQQLYQTQQS